MTLVVVTRLPLGSVTNLTNVIAADGRMNRLAASSGIVATFAQNAGHVPSRRRYPSTFDT